MLFITEDKLRYKYKKSPFDSYKLEKGNKLTPQARQFLIDLRIKIVDENNSRSMENKEKLKKIDLSQNEDTNVRLRKALIIKELANNIRKFDIELAFTLNKLAIGLFKGEKIDLDKLENTYDKAVYTYINMDIENPYISAFTIINHALEEYKKIQLDELYNKISNLLCAWFIEKSKGGETY